MKSTAKTIEHCQAELHIEAEQAEYDAATVEAFKYLAGRVEIPGFRKGKTPRPIFERFIGKEAIMDEAMEAVVPEAYYQAVAETGIEPVEQPKVDVVQAEAGKPVVFKATVQVKPEVILGQYKEVEVNKPSTEVPDASTCRHG